MAEHTEGSQTARAGHPTHRRSTSTPATLTSFSSDRNLNPAVGWPRRVTGEPVHGNLAPNTKDKY
ncbi:hypothetical protein N7509_001332 [Penicillium cosmopolitanum]|uniref:Uncharacterized protein n=1 Tax=Penicillium cosmopolitanum TaxID=1131564 RepID=A0A9W9WC25_9EURO|nr:uncharacterized protein N7509_001332 [Penicillium cosmopolitanum]KAJ5414705.1 hypothetical protein N7509_001332 [Penicillium cosmopolitanum]